MKETLFDPKKEHTSLPLNYYYLSEFSLTFSEEIRITSISIEKDAFNSRGSTLEPFYKPISIDFSEEK